MIETLQVIRCDTPVHLPARPPRPGHPTTDGRPRTVQCSRFFPARGGLTQAWQAALKRGWTTTVINARDRHTCPDHSTPSPTPGSTP